MGFAGQRRYAPATEGSPKVLPCHGGEGVGAETPVDFDLQDPGRSGLAEIQDVKQVVHREPRSALRNGRTVTMALAGRGV